MSGLFLNHKITIGKAKYAGVHVILRLAGQACTTPTTKDFHAANIEAIRENISLKGVDRVAQHILAFLNANISQFFSLFIRFALWLVLSLLQDNPVTRLQHLHGKAACRYACSRIKANSLANEIYSSSWPSISLIKLSKLHEL